MKIIYTGLESSGKSLLMARQILITLKRNKNWQKKYGFTRPVYLNLKLSKNIEKEYPRFIYYFKDVKEIIGKTGCDIFHDEISSHFSALKKEPLPLKVNRWLRQGAKQGVHYYATAQEFHDVHLDFRRRCKNAYQITKLFGTDRGGENLPPVNSIWGVCSVKQLVIHPYNELNPEFQFHSFFPFLLFGKSLCHTFDTHQVIDPSEEQPLEHRERICHDCGTKIISHGGAGTKIIWGKDLMKKKY